MIDSRWNRSLSFFNLHTELHLTDDWISFFDLAGHRLGRLIFFGEIGQTDSHSPYLGERLVTESLGKGFT
jgi:hypothetical protein